jgi:hypothetical protein
VYQTSLKSIDKLPISSLSVIFTMAAAAILQNSGTLPLSRIFEQACFI